MRKRKLAAVVVVVFVFTGFVGSTFRAGAAGGPPPFTNFTPPTQTGWSNPQTGNFVLLAANSPLGAQPRFFMVAPGDKADAYLVSWMGGGEVVWQGGITAGGAEWTAKLAKGGGRRGLIGTSADKQWTFVAIAPEGEWVQIAGIYNGVLKGGGGK